MRAPDRAGAGPGKAKERTSDLRSVKHIAAAALVALTVAASATADNYGGTSRTDQAKVVRLIEKRFGTGWSGKVAVCIARAESGLNPRAANWGDSNGGSHGLFQINGVHRAWAGQWHRVYDPWYNALLAWRISKGGRSWSAWTTAPGCT